MARRPIEGRLAKVARRYVNWLLAASGMLYLAALASPALQVFGGPVYGWECLIRGVSWSLLWLPNPLLLLAWIALSRKSQWGLVFSAVAFGMVVYSFAGGDNEGVLVGAHLWLAAVALSLSASILLVAAKRTHPKAHFQFGALPAGHAMDFGDGRVRASQRTRHRDR